MITLFKSLLGGIYGYIAIAGLAASLSFAGTLYVKGSIDDAKYSKLETAKAKIETASATAALSSLEKYIAGINEADRNFNSQVETLTKEISGLKTGITNAKKSNPLPVDCKPNADRLRILAASVASANKTASTSN